MRKFTLNNRIKKMFFILKIFILNLYTIFKRHLNHSIAFRFLISSLRDFLSWKFKIAKINCHSSHSAEIEFLFDMDNGNGGISVYELLQLFHIYLFVLENLVSFVNENDKKGRKGRWKNHSYETLKINDIT